MRSSERAFLAGVIGCALALAACGDDSTTPTDAGTDAGPRRDSGPGDGGGGMMDAAVDGGGGPGEAGVDAGTDAGPPTAAINIRVAHLVANGPNVKVCLGVRPAGMGEYRDVGMPITDSLAPNGIPYGGISNYNPAIFEPGRDYRLRLFAAASLPMGAMCPAFSDTDGRLYLIQVPDGALQVGHFYTVAATGLAPSPTTGMLPMVCGAMLNGPCTAGEDRSMGQVGFSVQLIEDADPATTDPMSPLVRVVAQSPNAPPMTICFDPDGPGAMAPVPIPGFEAIAFGTATDYVAPGMDLNFGFLAAFPKVTAMAGCNTVVPTGPTYIPLPIPIPPALEMMQERLDSCFLRNRRYTVFTAGIADTNMMMDPSDSTILPMRDSGDETDTAMDECGMPPMPPADAGMPAADGG